MSKAVKILFIVAAALIFCGFILFAAQMSVYGWDLNRLGAENYETNTNIVSESFSDISVDTDSADITFLASQGGECKVVCFEERSAKHRVCVENGVLKITRVNEKSWYEYVGFNFKSQSIKVYLPEAEYGALSVKADTANLTLPSALSLENLEVSLDTGDISIGSSVSGAAKITAKTGKFSVKEAAFGLLKATLSTGRVSISDVECGEITLGQTTGAVSLNRIKCRSLVSSGTTGDLDMNGVLVSGLLKIERSTGDVSFENCDAGEILIETRTGDVEGSLLSEKVFIAKSSTGEVEVPKTSIGGRCEITTKTGDIEIELSRRTHN